MQPPEDTTPLTIGQLSGVAEPSPEPPQRVEPRVPRLLVLLAGISWRLLVVAAAVYVIVMVVARLRVVLVPTSIALLTACALWPFTRRLRAAGYPRSIAALATLVALLAALTAVVALVAPSTAAEIGDLDVEVSGGVDVIEGWLTTGPLGLSEREVQSFFDRAEREVRAASARATGGAIGGAMLAIETVAGALLAIVLLFLFLKDGDRMWAWVRGLIPAAHRGFWTDVAVEVRDVLSGFIRGTTVVAAVDAVGIGVGLFLLGVPLVLPLAILTFIGGFVPLVGATVAGFVAVMVALVSSGFMTALAVLALVIGVQQLEGMLLQPLIVGRMVQLHPVVVLLAVAAGAALWGVVGALLAVPLTAALSTVLAALRRPSIQRVRESPRPGYGGLPERESP